MDLRIEWAVTDSLHDDVTLRIGDEFWPADSYYFALAAAHDASQADARRVFGGMLRLFVREITKPSIRKRWCLPFGLFDQGTVWLCVRRHGKIFETMVCPSSVEGWRIDLANKPVRRRIKAVRGCSHIMKLPCEGLIRDLERAADATFATGIPHD